MRNQLRMNPVRQEAFLRLLHPYTVGLTHATEHPFISVHNGRAFYIRSQAFRDYLADHCRVRADEELDALQERLEDEARHGAFRISHVPYMAERIREQAHEYFGLNR